MLGVSKLHHVPAVMSSTNKADVVIVAMAAQAGMI